MGTSGTGKNAKDNGQEGTEKGKPPYKKATKDIQIKKSCKKVIEAKNAEKGKPGLQNAVQEQLCQRDEERERNITKRVQEFKKYI